MFGRHGGGHRTLAVADPAAVRVQRFFHREVGTDFETWRRQVRLMKAVELLASGRRIKEVAFAVGYGQATTFVAMFRRSFGLTPKAWISILQA
jgi:AraC-like DNA-binding protein